MKEVYKFGGTSVDHLEHIAGIILSKKGEVIPHVCVSAFSGITDMLLSLVDDAKCGRDFGVGISNLRKTHYEKLENGIKTQKYLQSLKNSFDDYFDKKIGEIEKHLLNISKDGVEIKDFDPVIGFGEQISAFLLAELISILGRSNEIKGKFIDLGKIVIHNFEDANKLFINALREKISEKLIDENQDNEIPIITGFIGKVPGGILNGIDRGYTDFTSALVASVIKAKKFIIFKEVDGICTADPRIVGDKCILLKHLSYTEVLKMASSGMKAINTEAVKPAMEDSIPIEVRNTFYPDKEGTIITSSRSLNPNVKIQTIPSKKGVCIVRFGGYSDGLMGDDLWLKLYQLIKKHKVKKYFGTSDEAGYSVVVKYEEDKVNALIGDLQAFANVKVNYNCAIVGLVGEEMRGSVGIFALASNAISDLGVNIHMVCQGASEISISFVINEEHVEKVIKSIHSKFFEIKK